MLNYIHSLEESNPLKSTLLENLLTYEGRLNLTFADIISISEEDHEINSNPHFLKLVKKQTFIKQIKNILS